MPESGQRLRSISYFSSARPSQLDAVRAGGTLLCRAVKEVADPGNRDCSKSRSAVLRSCIVRKVSFTTRKPRITDVASLNGWETNWLRCRTGTKALLKSLHLAAASRKSLFVFGAENSCCGDAQDRARASDPLFKTTLVPSFQLIKVWNEKSSRYKQATKPAYPLHTHAEPVLWKIVDCAELQFAQKTLRRFFGILHIEQKQAICLKVKSCTHHAISSVNNTFAVFQALLWPQRKSKKRLLNDHGCFRGFGKRNCWQSRVLQC